MKILAINSTYATPHVCLNPNKGLFIIEGRSLVEDATAFYAPVMQWIMEYARDPNPATEFAFDFEYINVESSKAVLDVIAPLKKVKGVSIMWYCHHDRTGIIREMGEYLSELLGISFIYKTGRLQAGEREDF